MDPFTQRMLERAKARREKLDTQLSNAGHDVKRRRSPLREVNTLLSQTPDDSREQSPPIHKTKENFAVEEVKPSAKPSARLNRLAALASEINNWEDDLSHPRAIKPISTKAERVQAKLNEQVKNGSNPQPSTSGMSSNNANKSGSPSKPMKWEKSVLEYLGSNTNQQKSPSKTPTKSASSSALSKINEKMISTNNVGGASTSPSSSSTRSNESQKSKTPDKSVKSSSSSASSPAVSSTRNHSRYAYNGSPKSSLVQSPGSVLSKASMFESKGSATKMKDPAEMTLSERKALFERNKGEALIPKAPLTMSVPTKMLQEKEKTSPRPNGESANLRLKVDTGKAVGAQRSIFEQGTRIQELENNILQSVQAERQRELEMLRSRFNRNREMVQTALRTSESSEGKSTSPKNSPICPVKPTPATEQATPPPPPPLPKNNSRQNSASNNIKNSPIKRQVAASPPKSNPQINKLTDIKRIKVCQPRPGHLYPDLTNIESSSTETEFTIETTEAETATLDERTDTETGTEAEYYIQNEYSDSDTTDEDDDEDDIGNTSLGRSILQAVNQQRAVFNKKRSIEPDPDSTTSDISVLDEMDEYLDECLALQEVGEEGPTPPKLNRGGKSPSSASHSFKYTQGSAYRSPIKIISPVTSPRKEQYIIEDGDCVPLMHSVSLYRKQKSQTPKTPARVISRVTEVDATSSSDSSDEREAVLVQDKVKRLLDDVQKQQTIIGQASQALNLCNSTIEFSGSREQVEGERLLLLATHRRQAALNEVQRLKVEGTLRPAIPGAPEVQESGTLTISAITLPLKRDFFRHMEPETCIHFVCLVRYLETVIATQVVQAELGDSCVRFSSTLKLQDLYNDFKVTIEVYSLQTRAEILPHEIKYHIHGNGNGGSSSSSNKKNGGKTPKKFLKQESKLVMPNIQSPAGPSAVRTTSFSLAGYVVFSLKEVHKQQFTLNKVPMSSPLEGRLQMHVSCELTVSVDHHGFLTMFEDVSGFGAWHRRWCLLKGATLSYWKYPDDERKKTPIGSLDLQSVSTTNVNLVSRDICARPHTFLLETTRPAQPGDTDSLTMLRNGSQTTIRHLLSADTKEERLEWCAKLNKTLHLIRAWGGTTT